MLTLVRPALFSEMTPVSTLVQLLLFYPLSTAHGMATEALACTRENIRLCHPHQKASLQHSDPGWPWDVSGRLPATLHGDHTRHLHGGLLMFNQTMLSYQFLD